MVNDSTSLESAITTRLPQTAYAKSTLSTSPPCRSSQSFPVWLWCLVISTRAAISFAAALHPALFTSPDSVGYLALGSNLATHSVFSQAQTPPWLPELTRLPGYPLFLAVLSFVPGFPFTAIVVMHAILSSATAWLLWRWLTQMTSPRAATIACTFAIFDLVTLFHQPMVLSETLYLAILQLALLSTWRTVQSNQIRDGFFAGLLWSATNLVRPVFWYFPPFLSMIWWKRGSRSLLGVFLIGAYLLTGAWVIRNGVRGGYWGLTALEGDVLLRYPAASVIAIEAHLPFTSAQQLLLTEAGRQDRADSASQSKAYSALATHVMRAHPWTTMVVCLNGAVRILGGTGLEMLAQWMGHTPTGGAASAKVTGDSTIQLLKEFPWLIPIEMLYVAWLLVAYVGFLVGMAAFVRAGRRREAWVLTFACAYVIAISSHQGYYRFRIPLVPFLAAGVAAAIDRRTLRRPS